MAIQIKDPIEVTKLAGTFGLTENDIDRTETGEIYIKDTSNINKAITDFSNLTGRSAEFSNQEDIDSIKKLMNPEMASTNVANNMANLTPQEQIKAKTSELTEANVAGGGGLSVLQSALQNKIGTQKVEQEGFGLSELYKQAGINPSYSNLNQSLLQRQNEITGDINNLRNVLSDVSSMEQSKALRLQEDLNLLKFDLEEAQRKEDLVGNQALSLASSMLQSGEKIPESILGLLNPSIQNAYRDAGNLMNYAKKTERIDALAEEIYNNDLSINSMAEARVKAEEQYEREQQGKELAIIDGKSIKLPEGYIYDDSTYATDPEHTQKVQNIYNDLLNYADSRDSRHMPHNTIHNWLLENKPNSTYTGADVVKIAEKYDIDPYLFQAMLQQESGSGTSNVSLDNNNPAGITWSKTYQDANPGVTKGTPRPVDEGGYYVKFPTIQDGLEKVAYQIARRTTKLPTEEELDKTIENITTTEEAEETEETPTYKGNIDLYAMGLSQDTFDVLSGVSENTKAYYPNDRQRKVIAQELNKAKSALYNSESFSDQLRSSVGGDMAKNTNTLSSISSAVSQIGNIMEDLQKEGSGPLKGAIKKNNPWETNAKAIKAQLEGLIPQIARGIYGEKGVLTDEDINRYRGTVPDLTNVEQANKLMTVAFFETAKREFKSKLEEDFKNKKDVSRWADDYDTFIEEVDKVYQKLGIELVEPETSDELDALEKEILGN